MHFAPNNIQPAIVINEYAPEQNSLTINKALYQQSMIITDQTVVGSWQPEAFEHITEEELLKLKVHGAETLIIGTGSQQHFLPDELSQTLIKHFPSHEVMNTLSACRTFNLLSADGRSVIAALII